MTPKYDDDSKFDNLSDFKSLKFSNLTGRVHKSDQIAKVRRDDVLIDQLAVEGQRHDHLLNDWLDACTRGDTVSAEKLSALAQQSLWRQSQVLRLLKLRERGVTAKTEEAIIGFAIVIAILLVAVGLLIGGLV